jgi:hypothetical protein
VYRATAPMNGANWLNLHPEERRLNQALDVEIFRLSGNESY